MLRSRPTGRQPAPSPPPTTTPRPPEDHPARRTTLALAMAVFGTALAAYAGLATWAGRTKSPTMAYYPDLAGAFVQGRLDLGPMEINRDLTLHDGAWYLAFPPLPALLMIPEAWLRGPAAVNSVRYSALLGAAAPAFLFLMLEALARRRLTRLSLADNLGLTFLFAFGSVALYMSLAGTVWLTSQVVAVAFAAAAAWLSVEDVSPFLPGTALALAVLARPVLILSAPFLFGLGLSRIGGEPSARRRAGIRWAWQAGLPAILACLLLLAYNQARFGNPLDFGYAEMNVSPDLSEGFERHGQFDIRFVPRNLEALLTALPVWDPACRAWVPDPWGMSLFLTMPALIYLIRARGPSPWIRGAWLSIGLTLVPLLLYHNTGYYQFGYRFSLDFLVPAVALLAFAAGARLSLPLKALILTGAGINLLGTAWFFERWCA